MAPAYVSIEFEEHSRHSYDRLIFTLKIVVWLRETNPWFAVFTTFEPLFSSAHCEGVLQKIFSCPLVSTVTMIHVIKRRAVYNYKSNKIVRLSS